MSEIEFLDTTLRDGAQAVGISFSPRDKLSVLKLLDEFGIDLVEGGDPASNPKDSEFFATVRNKKLVAFGSTCRRGNNAENDINLSKLLSAGTDAVCIFGKADAAQARDVLGVSPEENLRLISDSVSFLRGAGKRVIFDAEHFFDGYKADSGYALTALMTAYSSGADTLVLCDTNGGTMPKEIAEITAKIVNCIAGAKIGVHAHNDSGTAVAAAIMAADAGATHIQGTFLGFGERCGNTNLSTTVADLKLKKGYDINCDLTKLLDTAQAIAEISNIKLDEQMPYVGAAAFSHKAGMHADAVLKNPDSFEHVPPESVGNRRRILLSEVAGRSAVANKLEKIIPSLNKSNPKTREILDAVKLLEMKGYQFEGADGSFIMLAERMTGNFKPSFELEHYKITETHPAGENTAEVCIRVNGALTSATEHGNGPVNALDKALRSALKRHFPQIEEVSLTDYKVRVIDSASATGAMVRVLITSSDKTNSWTTVGVSTDIIEASWNALTDSIEYKLTGQGKFF